MANNRMFLIHKPSGVGIGLAKSFDTGWRGVPEQKEFQRFFDYIYGNCEWEERDDFMLAMEDGLQGWDYTKGRETVNGFMKFIIKEEKLKPSTPYADAMIEVNQRTLDNVNEKSILAKLIK